MFCTRCNKDNAKILFMSVFNNETICVSCKEKEEEHTLYKEAVLADREAIKKGVNNFEGIGLPNDLATNN